MDVLIETLLLLTTEIVLVTHDEAPGPYMGLAVGSFKTHLQRINAQRGIGRQSKKRIHYPASRLELKGVIDVARHLFSLEEHPARHGRLYNFGRFERTHDLNEPVVNAAARFDHLRQNFHRLNLDKRPLALGAA